MLGITLGLGLCLLGTSLYLFHQTYTVRQLTRQIETKRQTKSQGRLRLSLQSRTLVDLSQAIQEVFKDQEAERITSQQERRDLDQAISNIAHDIRTPLTIASGYTQQALKQVKAQELPDVQALEKVHQQLKQVSGRLEALLDYRRVLEHEVKPSFARVDVHQLLLETALTYYESFQRAGLRVDLDLAPGPIWLETDPELLVRVLQNLLGNLLKHGKGQGRISLSLQADHLQIRLDNQMAQPIQQVRYLTKRFYSENLSEVESSSGLGLYISQQLVQLLGGQLTLSSQDLDFSVCVSLPLR